jgi:15-cis-phytoene synthase
MPQLSSTLQSDSDARVCERLTRTHARTFARASVFLPAAKRRAVFGLYAFCRVVDDLVDDAAPDAGVRLDAFAARLDAALANVDRGGDPVLREVVRAVAHYHVPRRVLTELIEGVRCDLSPVRYASWHALERYCAGVASSVGEMCTYVFGVGASAERRTRAVRRARTLGVAMQLTNILRDVGDDARRGRCYLPLDELASFGLDVDDVMGGRDVVHRPEWAAFMRHQIARARALYHEGSQGIALLEPDAQRCATACATGYAEILRAIERRGLDTIGGRAIVGPMARVGVLWRAWRSPIVATPESPAAAPTNDAIEWA